MAERVSGPRGERHRHLFARLSPGARAALAAGPPPPGRVGGGPRLASRAPPPAPPSRPRSPARTPRTPSPGPLGRAPGDPGEDAGLPPASLADGSGVCARGRALARRLAPPGLFPAAAAASTHIYSHGYTQIHSRDSRGPGEPLRRGDPPRPPPAGRAVDLSGAAPLLPGSWRGCPATEWGGTVRGRPDSGMGAAGGRSRGPAGFQVSRGESGAVWVPTRPGPAFLPRTSPWRSGSAGVAASPTLSHFSDTGARDLLALFLPFPLRAPTAAEGPAVLRPATPLPAAPHSPSRPARELEPSLALPRGRSPRVPGTTSGQRKAQAAGRGRSVFRAPLSFHRPLGCVVLPLADWLREELRLGDQKTTNPCIPRDESGRGAVLGVLVLGDWRWELTKRMVGRLCTFSVLDTLHVTHVLYLIFSGTLRGTIVSSLENTVLLARDLKAPWWWR